MLQLHVSMNVLDFIAEQKSFYENQTIEIPGNAAYSQSSLINSINHARQSKYLSGDAKDDIIGDYPYDNVSKYRIRLEARATDFDPKHAEIEPLNGSREARVAAMVATQALRKHMREIDFGAFLDDYADTRPEYGGFLAKKTKEGIQRTPWENVITDMSNILGGVIIERHYMLPSELKKTNWKNVDETIRTASAKKKEQDMKQDNGESTKTITDLIEIWEMHGEVQLSIYKEAEADFNGEEYEPGDDDDVTFVTCQVICAPQGKDENGKMKGLILQANEEAKLPYKYDSRNPMQGRGLGEGIPEELSEHQRWHNFYKTEEARAVAIGGKVLFVTDDGNVVDTIYDNGIQHGTILKIGEGKNFTQANVLPTSVPLYQAIDEKWEQSGDKVTSSFDTKIGAPAKSGTTFRGQFIEDENATSQFLQYREKMGRFIREVIEDWVLPDALASAAKDNEIYATFSKAELQLIDEVLIERELIDRRAKIILNEKRAISAQELEAMRIGLETEIAKTGSRRAITEIKDFIKNEVLGKVVIHTTDEDRSKAVLFESYSNLLNVLQPGSPESLAIIDKIMDMLGITREQLALYTPTPEAQMAAQEAAQGGKPAPVSTKKMEAQDTLQKVIPG